MREIPLFPLNTVLFPGVPLPLHIFEPRYRLMLRRCLADKIPFGVVLIRHGVEALGPLAEPYSFGTSANIAHVEPLPDGRMNLIAIGEERFRIIEVNDSQPYLTAKVECMPMEQPATISVARGVHHLKPWVSQYLTILSRLDDEEMASDLEAFQLPEDPLAMIYMAASLLQIPLAEKQGLLEAQTSAHLLKMVYRLFRREVSVLGNLAQTTEESAQRLAWLN